MSLQGSDIGAGVTSIVARQRSIFANWRIVAPSVDGQFLPVRRRLARSSVKFAAGRQDVPAPSSVLGSIAGGCVHGSIDRDRAATHRVRCSLAGDRQCREHAPSCYADAARGKAPVRGLSGRRAYARPRENPRVAARTNPADAAAPIARPPLHDQPMRRSLGFCRRHRRCVPQASPPCHFIGCSF